MLLKKIQENLKKHMIWYVSISIVLGWLLGYFNGSDLPPKKWTER